MPQRIGLGLVVADALPAVGAAVAHAGADQAEEALAQVEVDGDAMLLAPLRRGGGDAGADALADGDAAGEAGAVTSSGGESAGVGAEGGGVEADGGFSKFPLTFSTPTVSWISAIALRFASTVPIM